MGLGNVGFVDESSWLKKFEAEIPPKVKRRQEKYKVGGTKHLADHGS